MRTRLSSLKKYLPVGVYRRLVERRTVGFFYHVVSKERLPHILHLYPYKSPEAFEDDLVYLRNEMHPTGYEELEETRRAGKRLPARSVVLSFDDGMSECYSVIRPLLLKYKLPAIFFITTGLTGKGQMLPRHKVSLCLEKVKESPAGELNEAYQRMNEKYGQTIDSARAFERWIGKFKAGDEQPIDDVCEILGVDWKKYLADHDVYMNEWEIRKLHAEGFTIGAHSVTHPKMGTVSPEVMEAEMVQSVRAVCEMTGEIRAPFAFPFTATGVDRTYLDGVVQRHPEIGLLFDSKGIQRDREYIFNRIWADVPGTSLEKLIEAAYREARGD